MDRLVLSLDCLRYRLRLEFLQKSYLDLLIHPHRSFGLLLLALMHLDIAILTRVHYDPHGVFQQLFNHIHHDLDRLHMASFASMHMASFASIDGIRRVALDEALHKAPFESGSSPIRKGMQRS
jgi:hypothetical protein